jgi:hypothetical protein
MTYLIYLEDGQELEAQTVWLNGDSCIYVDGAGTHTIAGNDFHAIGVIVNGKELDERLEKARERAK